MATLAVHVEDVIGLLKANGYANVYAGYVRDIPADGAVIVTIVRGAYPEQANYASVGIELQFYGPAFGEHDSTAYPAFINKLDAGGATSIRGLYKNANLPHGAQVVVTNFRVPTTIEKLASNRTYYTVVVEATLYLPAAA